MTYNNQSLRLVWGSATTPIQTIWLSETGINLQTRFIPGTPSPMDENITDSIDLVFAAESNSRKLIRDIEQMLVNARKWSELQIGNRVYLEFKQDKDDADFYRSEIIDGRLILSTNAIESKVTKNTIEATLALTRKPWWEGAEVQLPLNDTHYLGNTSGLMIYNPSIIYGPFATISFDNATSRILDSGSGLAIFATGDTIHVTGSTDNDGVSFMVTDGGHAAFAEVSPAPTTEAAGDLIYLTSQNQNFWWIAKADIEGDLPSPVITVIENGDAALELANIYLSLNTFLNYMISSPGPATPPQPFEYLLEAENWTDLTGTLTLQDSGIESGGYTAAVSFTSATGTDLLKNPFDIGIYAGHYFRPIVCAYFDPAYTDLWFRFVIKDGDANPELWTGEWFEATFILTEAPIMKLPPAYDPLIIYSSNAKIYIQGKRTGGAAADIYFDYIQFSPLDGWRKLIPRQAPGCPPNYEIVDDNVYDLIWTQLAANPLRSGAEFARYYTNSSPLLIQPGMVNLFMMLVDDTMGANYVVKQWNKIKQYYRPRRLTI